MNTPEPHCKETQDCCMFEIVHCWSNMIAFALFEEASIPSVGVEVAVAFGVDGPIFANI